MTKENKKLFIKRLEYTNDELEMNKDITKKENILARNITRAKNIETENSVENIDSNYFYYQ